MKLRFLCLCFILVGTWVRGEAIPFRPFVIDHQSRVDSEVDVSFLLKGPAGKAGFVHVKEGHLVTGDDLRFRIWGVNLTGWVRGSTNLPPKTEAVFWAKTLSRYGINCVRMHFLDLTTRTPEEEAANDEKRIAAEAKGEHFAVRPVGLVDGKRKDTMVFDPDAIDRLDYFIAELKKVGIYCNLNLNVGRTYKEGDGVPDYDLISVAKGVTYVGPRLLELQRDYARQLLTHFNPYTKTEYRNEPAVATVEIVNENSLYEFWFRNWLRGDLKPGSPKIQLDFTPYYATKLDEKFQAWLTQHRTAKEVAQIRKLAGVAEGAAVPRLRRGDFSIAPQERFYAEAEFYGDVEKEFLTGMHDFLKKDLGVKSLVIGTADHTYWIPNLPLLRANSLMDFGDGHVYWQHPAIWGARNTPMVDQPLHSTIVKLSRSPMLGRPFTVSEVNHPNPNEYTSEMIPILAAYAAFQDWDGIYFYTFEPKFGDKDKWPHFVADNFDISLDPVKMSQLAVGALLFSRADVSPAKQVVSRTYSKTQVNEAMRMSEAERPYFTPGFALSTALRHGSRLQSLDTTATKSFAPEVAPPFVSDTGELTWSVSPEKRGLVTIDTPRTQALVGFVKSNQATTKHLAPEVKNDFCAITLSSLTPDPIQRASTLLLTATSRWQNTGSEWNSRRTLWEKWGNAPTLIEPVVGWIVLRELDGAVDVTASPLDGAAKPIGEPLKGRRLEDGWEIPLGEPATTQYLIHVVR